MSDSDVHRRRRVAQRSIAKRDEALETFGLARNQLTEALGQEPFDVPKIRECIRSMTYHYSVVETESGFLISLESDREVKHSALNWLTEIENDCKDMVRDAESVIHRAVNLANRSLGGDRMDPSLVGRGTPVSHRSRDACSNGTPRIDAKVPLRNPTHSRAGTPRVQPEHFHDIKKTTLLSMDGTRPWLSPKSEPRQIFDGHRNPPGSVKRPSNPNQTLQSQSSTGVSRQGLAKTSSRTKPSPNHQSRSLSYQAWTRQGRPIRSP